MNSEDCFIGIDIGKTKILAGLVASSGQILKEIKVPTNLENADVAIIKQCKELICELISVAPTPVLGIGIGSFGIVDAAKGLIIGSSSIKKWRNINIVEILQKEFDINIFVENDANAGALGEYLFGAGKYTESSVYVCIGTGFGVCTIINGKIHNGKHSLAGEIGNVIISDGRKVQHIISGRGISTNASKLIGKELSTEEVFQLASEGNEIAIEVCEDAIETGALILSIVNNLFDPNVIILGGSVMLKQPQFFESLKERTNEKLTIFKDRLPEGANMKLAELGEKSIMMGAAALCMKKLLQEVECVARTQFSC